MKIRTAASYGAGCLPRLAKGLLAGGACYLWLVAAVGQGTQPLVAIHDSELTRALESMPATGRDSDGQWHDWLPMVANGLALFRDA